MKDAALPAPGAVLAVTGNSHKDALKRASALAELVNVEMTALGLPSVTHRTLVTLTSAKVGHSVKLFVKCAHHRPPPRPPADARLTVAELKSARGVTQLSAEWWRIRQHRAVGSKCSTATAVARRLRELLDVDGLSSSPDETWIAHRRSRHTSRVIPLAWCIAERAAPANKQVWQEGKRNVVAVNSKPARRAKSTD